MSHQRHKIHKLISTGSQVHVIGAKEIINIHTEMRIKIFQYYPVYNIESYLKTPNAPPSLENALMAMESMNNDTVNSSALEYFASTKMLLEEYIMKWKNK